MDDDKKHMAQIAETLNLVQKEEPAFLLCSSAGKKGLLGEGPRGP